MLRGAAKALRRSEGLELPLLGGIDRVGEGLELGLLLRLTLHVRLRHGNSLGARVVLAELGRVRGVGQRRRVHMLCIYWTVHILDSAYVCGSASHN